LWRTLLLVFKGMKRDAVPGMSINGRQASSERTAQGYRRFRCGNCGKQFNERSAGVLNRAQYPSEVIALVVLWRLRYKLSLRDLAEMFLIRGLVFSYEAVRDSEAKLTPALAENLRRRRKGKVGRSWYVDETYIRVRGGWRYLLPASTRRMMGGSSTPAVPAPGLGLRNSNAHTAGSSRSRSRRCRCRNRRHVVVVPRRRVPVGEVRKRDRRRPGSHVTLRWRGLDSNYRFRADSLGDSKISSE
jgi:hypothetical protein